MTTLATPAAASQEQGTRVRALRSGMRDITPMVVGVLPFAVAIGAAAADEGMSAATTLFSAVSILAGAAQLTTLHLLGQGVSPVVIVASALIINARLALYSVSMAPWFRDEPLGRRLLLAMPVIDQLHLTCIPRFEEGTLDADERRWYYTGAAGLLVGSWLGAQTIAVLGGARLPEGVGLEIAAPLALAGLLAKSTIGKRARIASVAASTVAVVGVGAPFNSAVLVGCLVGIATGFVRGPQAIAEDATAKVQVRP